MAQPSASTDWSGRWNHFWFTPEPADVLALLRIFFGIALLLEITGATGLYRLPHLEASMPRHFASPAQYPLDAVYLPVPGFEWLPVPSFAVFRLLEMVLVPLCVLFIAGLFTRWVGPLLALLYLYFFLLSQLFYHHHVLLLVVGLVVIGFSRCGEHYSLDAYLASPDAEPRPSVALPRRLLQVFVPIVYLFSVAQKLNDGWITGGFIELLDVTDRVQGPVAALMMDLIPYRVLSDLTLATELFLGIAFAIPGLHLAGIWVGTLFHLGIDLILPVGAYSYAMLALYISYLKPGPGRTIVLFDGRCGFCQRSIRVARLLDWFRRVSWLDFRDDAIARSIPPLPLARLEAQMVVITPAGEVCRGFFAWRALFRVFPLTFLAWPLTYIPPVPRLGKQVYARIAEHRHRLASTTACAIPGHQVNGKATEPWRETWQAIEPSSELAGSTELFKGD